MRRKQYKTVLWFVIAAALGISRASLESSVDTLRSDRYNRHMISNDRLIAGALEIPEQWPLSEPIRAAIGELSPLRQFDSLTATKSAIQRSKKMS